MMYLRGDDAMSKHRRKQAPTSQAKKVEGPRETDVTRFDNFKNVGYALIGVVFAAAISVNDFQRMWVVPSHSSELPLFIARIVFFGEVVALTISWVLATHHEFDLWMHWLTNPFPNMAEVYRGMFSLAVFLGIALAFPHRITFITGFITLSLLLNYWTQWLANDHFARAMQRTLVSSPDDTTRSVLRVMEAYWVGRPQLARIATTMLFASFAFTLAFSSTFQPDWQSRRYQLAAYVLLTVTIFVSEVVIAVWRHKRDRALRQAANQ
jgi:uncharacterized membrane protein